MEYCEKDCKDLPRYKDCPLCKKYKIILKIHKKDGYVKCKSCIFIDSWRKNGKN